MRTEETILMEDIKEIYDNAKVITWQSTPWKVN